MKNISTILSIVALGLIGVLFYLFVTHTEEIKRVSVAAERNAHTNFRIAYFDIDSLQAHYEYYKDALDQVKEKENAMNAQLESLKNKYQHRIMELQKKGPNMTQSEGEAAQQEFSKMQQTYEDRKNALADELQNHQMDLMKDLRKKIEDYLADYNKDKHYAYILSYQPGFIVYYKDTAYNITDDLIAGLNKAYKGEKKSSSKK